jgi:hypothetical protein
MNQIINQLSPDNIIRCIDCNLISSLKLNYNEGIASITFECENNHKGNILLKDYMTKYNKYALSKEKCGICDKNQKEFKEDFYYCNKCKIFLCGLCKHNHNEDKNDIIPYKKYDFICKIHSSLYSFYCINCKKNLCIRCEKEHINHEKISLINMIIDKKDLLIKLNEIKNIINVYNENINKIIEILNNMKKDVNNYYKLIEYMVNNYNEKDRNYEILNNINEMIINNNMINDITKINNENDIKNQFNNILDIYNKKNIIWIFYFQALSTSLLFY